MDERQKIVKRVFTKEQLESMSVDDLVKLVGEFPGAKFTGTAVVRKANGEIKYDDPTKAGTYEEGV